MLNNKKFLALIIFIILLVPQLALMQTVQIGTCVDHKIFDQKSNKDTFWKCCWSNGNDDPAKWSPQQDIGTYCMLARKMPLLAGAVIAVLIT